MTTPLTPPQFGDKYNVGLTDIGSGYAAGITSAGNSIAGAIGAVMGGINQKTGEAQAGILGQKKDAEDNIDMLHLHGMLTDDEYAKAKTMSLSGQQKLIGMNAADFTAKLKGQIEQQNQLAVANAQNVAAMQRTQAGESGATTRTGMTDEAAMARIRLELQKNQMLDPYVRTTPVPPSPLFAPPNPATNKTFNLGQ